MVGIVAALAAGGWYWYQSRDDDGEVRYRLAKAREQGEDIARVASA